MIQAFLSVLTVLIICAVGFYLQKKGAINKTILDFLSQITIRIAVPAIMFVYAYQNFTREFVSTSGKWMIFPLAFFCFLYFIAFLISKFSLKNKNDKGVFCSIITLPNTITMGIPITLSISGQKGLPHLISYFVTSTIFLWLFAAGQIAKDGGAARLKLSETIKRIFSVPMLSFMLGCFFSLTEINVPQFIFSSLEYLAGMNTPLTLIMTGAIIAGTEKENILPTKTDTIMTIGRLLLSPMLCLAGCLLFSVPQDMARVFVIMSGLPSMNQILNLSSFYGANEKIAAKLMMLTTIFSVASIPVVVFVLDLAFK